MGSGKRIYPDVDEFSLFLELFLIFLTTFDGFGNVLVEISNFLRNSLRIIAKTHEILYTHLLREELVWGAVI